MLDGDDGAVNTERLWAEGDCQWTREHLQQRKPEVDATPSPSAPRSPKGQKEGRGPVLMNPVS